MQIPVDGMDDASTTQMTGRVVEWARRYASGEDLTVLKQERDSTLPRKPMIMKRPAAAEPSAPLGRTCDAP